MRAPCSARMLVSECVTPARSCPVMWMSSTLDSRRSGIQRQVYRARLGAAPVSLVRGSPANPDILTLYCPTLFRCQRLVKQHLEISLIAEAFLLRQFPGPSKIGLRQADRDRR